MSKPVPATGLDRLPPPVQTVAGAMEAKKAFDIVVLDLRETGAFTDFFVVGSGHSTRQVKAITDAVDASLKADGHRPTHIEGYDHAEWVLIDCFEVIVHIFTDATRRQYDLERLWGRAQRIEIAPPATPTSPDGAASS